MVLGALFRGIGLGGTAATRLPSAISQGVRGAGLDKIPGYLTKTFGGSSIAQRALIGGGFFGAAAATESYYDAVEERLSSYYGKTEYTRKYKEGLDATSTGIETLFNIQGVFALLGRDIISKGIGTARYRLAPRQARMFSETSSFNVARDAAGAGQVVKRSGFSPKVQHRDVVVSKGSYYTSGYGPRDPRRIPYARGTYQPYPGSTVPPPMNLPAFAKEAQKGRVITSTAAMPVVDARIAGKSVTAQTTNYTTDQNLLHRLFGKIDPKFNYLGNRPRLKMGSYAFLGLTAANVAGIDTVISPATASITGALFELSGGFGRFSKRAAGIKGDPARAREFFGRATGVTAKQQGRFVASRLGMTAGVIGAGAGLGAAFGSNNQNRFVEGNITSFKRHNESGVRRMNFSTAGLVQALHRTNSNF